MAVVSVQETFNGRTGSTTDAAVNTYTRVFIVGTDSTLDGPVTVLSATGVPQVFDTYSDPNGQADLLAVCTKVTPTQRSDDPFTWDVTAEYSSDSRDEQWFKRHPLERPPVVSWSFERYQKPLDRDLTGNPLTDSANVAFPAIDADDHRPCLTITRNEAGFDPTLAQNYQDTVNADNFAGVAPGGAKIQSIGAEMQYESRLFFWKVTYTIHFRLPQQLVTGKPGQGKAVATGVRVVSGFNALDAQGNPTQMIQQPNQDGTITVVCNGWDLLILDRGYQQIGPDGKLAQITVGGGALPSVPVLLDGLGKPIARNADGTLKVLPWYRLFRIYPYLPFAPLNLPF